MIEIVAATRLLEQEFWNRSALGISLRRLAQDTRLVARIAYANQRGLPEIYNARIAAAGAEDVLVFMHDDVWIDDYFFWRPRRRRRAGLRRHRRRRQSTPGSKPARMGIRRHPVHLGRNGQSHGIRCARKDPVRTASTHFGPVPAECELLDGVLLAARKVTLARQRRELRSSLRFSFLRHGFLPQREAARTAPGDMADLPHASEWRCIRSGDLVGEISRLPRKVGGLARRARRRPLGDLHSVFHGWAPSDDRAAPAPRRIGTRPYSRSRAMAGASSFPRRVAT